ncbi:hypothetical protein T08_13293 [Trichinella sp. T8]|nr:hypothetical protein T08_13293 [Trichinella sp. T8]
MICFVSSAFSLLLFFIGHICKNDNLNKMIIYREFRKKSNNEKTLNTFNN